MLRIGPVKRVTTIFADRDDHNPWPQLRNAEVRRVEQSPLRLEAQFSQIVAQTLPIVAEHGVQKTAHILDHDSTGTDFLDNAQGVGEQVAVVTGTKLLACDREWWARQPARHKIDTPIGGSVEGTNVGLAISDDVPVRAVQHQRGTAMAVDFNKCPMAETGAFKPKRLSTATCTKFHSVHLPAYRRFKP